MSRTNVNAKRRGATAAFTLVELIVSVGLSAIIFAGILAGYTFLARNFTRLLNTQDQDTKSRHAVRLFSQDIAGAIQISAASADTTGATLKLVLPATAGGAASGSSPAGIRKGQIEAFTPNTLSNASAGWGNLVNSTAPWYVRITSGPSAGKLLPIVSNTGTTITVGNSDPTPLDLTALGLVAGTDTFELAATVTYTYTGPAAGDPASGKLTRADDSGAVDLLKNLTSLGFNYFDVAGGSVTSNPLSVKEVELTFASALGDSTSGTQSRYASVSPRLVLRNKTLLQ